MWIISQKHVFCLIILPIISCRLLQLRNPRKNFMTPSHQSASLIQYSSIQSPNSHLHTSVKQYHFLDLNRQCIVHRAPLESPTSSFLINLQQQIQNRCQSTIRNRSLQKRRRIDSDLPRPPFISSHFCFCSVPSFCGFSPVQVTN